MRSPVHGRTFHVVSLGCAKNAVDAESMAEVLARSGLVAAADPDSAAVLIVNTCGFIAAARAESLAVLRAMAARKRPDQSLIAAGCLSQRDGVELSCQVPGIDGVLGTRRWMDIVAVVEQLRRDGPGTPRYDIPFSEAGGLGETADAHRVAVQGTSAYLKIADGCRRRCAFCTIPSIKGPAVSRPLAAILADAVRLQSQGVHEIILIAQDTTDYGHDLGLKDGLATLLRELTKVVPDVPWLRVMYAYPGCVTDQLIEVMATHQQVVPYLDMPLQHAHPDVLRRMRRPANMEWFDRTIDRMRTAMPDLALRSTFIVGHPGEGEAEFEALLDFVAEACFDRLGAFQYSFERGTPGERLGDPVPAEVKQSRWERLMTLQQGISSARNQTFVGRTLMVLVEGQDDGISVGRTYRDAPEIDGLVLVEGEVRVGEMVPVRITGAMPYDLAGRVVNWTRDTGPQQEVTSVGTRAVLGKG
jgi:ribosomal protein S12 methylthiotransferase